MNTPPFTTGQGFLLAVSTLSWLAVAFVLTSTHLSTVVGAWLLAHGVEMAKFRAARRRLTGDMQRLAETMIPPAAEVVTDPDMGNVIAPYPHSVGGQHDAKSGMYVAHCVCGWNSIFPTLEEMQAAGFRHRAYMENLAAEAEADDRGV
jgi:hypothetical protein